MGDEEEEVGGRPTLASKVYTTATMGIRAILDELVADRATRWEVMMSRRTRVAAGGKEKKKLRGKGVEEQSDVGKKMAGDGGEAGQREKEEKGGGCLAFGSVSAPLC